MFSEDLVERLVQQRRAAASIEAECTALVAEMIRRDIHDDLGYRSMTSLLMDRLGVSAGVARAMISVATAVAEMPFTLTALTSGDIDLARVRLLVAAREVNPALFEDHEDAHPLLSRCTVFSLTNQGLAKAFALRAQEIAQAEGLDGRPLDQYVRLVQRCRNNLRAVLQCVESGAMQTGGDS